jgi:hypothetical protein
MSLDRYGNSVELVIPADKQEQFDAGARKIRDTIVRHGFSQEAADMISFKLAQYTLEITPEQSRSGAFHIHADGKPVYEVTVTAPGNMMEGGLDGTPTTLPARKQAQYLSFEIGMNLMMPVKDVLKQFYGETDDRVSGGVSGGMEFKYETTMRCEPWKYMAALNDLVEYRLNMIAPVAPSAPKKRPGGMQP